MKMRPVLRTLVAVILSLGSEAGYSQIQTYYYSGPVSGYTDVELTPGGAGYGGFSTSFGTVTETLYYSTVYNTLQQIVGSVTVNPSSGSFDIQSGPFYPPSDSGSATITVGNNGSFSFDILPNGSSTFTGPLLVPVSGSGTYNGQSFSGNWDIDIPMVTYLTAATPTSLTFSQSGFQGAQPGQDVIPGTNLRDANSDDTYYYSWQVSDAVATAVPDPPCTMISGALLLLPLGSSGFRLLRHKFQSA
ncbi:MAG: hypothetical protein ACLQVY_12735 [Limisphaerales bacterium]